MSLNGRFSDEQVLEFIETLQAGGSFAALFTADPYLVDPDTAEAPGATYRRPQVLWEPLSGRVVANRAVLEWWGLDLCSITHVGVFSAPIGGFLRLAVPLTKPVLIVDGGGYRVLQRELFIRF